MTQAKLKVLITYGVAGGGLLFLLMLILSPLLMVVAPTAFNLMLWKKLKTPGIGRDRLFLCLIISVFTTIVAALQFMYREHHDWACIGNIPDWKANLSYASTMVLFSLLGWGYGTALLESKT